MSDLFMTLTSLWWIVRNLPAIFRVLWKAETGHWYYLRDESDEFVETLAHMPDDEDDMQKVIVEARQELARRARRGA